MLAFIALAFLVPDTAQAEKCYPKNLYREYWQNRNIFDTMKRSEKRLMPLPRQVAKKWSRERSKRFWRGATFVEFDIWWREGALLKIRKDAWRARTERSRAKQKRFEACKLRNKTARKQEAEARRARAEARKKKRTEERFAELAKHAADGEIICSNRNCRQCRGGNCVPVGKLSDLHKNPAICPGTDPSNDLKEDRSLCRSVRRDRERAANPRPKRRRRPLRRKRRR